MKRYTRIILQALVQVFKGVLVFTYMMGMLIIPYGLMGHSRVKEAIIFAIVYSIIMIGGIYLLNKLYKKLL